MSKPPRWRKSREGGTLRSVRHKSIARRYQSTPPTYQAKAIVAGGSLLVILVTQSLGGLAYIYAHFPSRAEIDLMRSEEDKIHTALRLEKDITATEVNRRLANIETKLDTLLLERNR